MRQLRGQLAFGTIDTWLLWKLTGGSTYAIDPSKIETQGNEYLINHFNRLDYIKTARAQPAKP